MIPIVSQTYCDPKAFAWQHELIAFIKLASEDKLGLKTKVGGGNTASRVLPVRIHEVEARDKKLFEEATGGIMRPIDFIYKESGVNRPLRPSDDRGQNQEHTDYRNQVNKVANAIKDIIAGLQGSGDSVISVKGSEEERGPIPAARDRKPRRNWKIRFPEVNSQFSLGLAVVAILGFIALAVFHFSEPAPDNATYRSTLLPPGNMITIGRTHALSPDGKLLVFVATDSSIMGRNILWVRPLNALSGSPLRGTEGAVFPFWSSDSRSIGYFADGKLKRVEASGGASQTICESGVGGGGSWSAKGTIIFSPRRNTGTLLRVPATGGSPIPITKLVSDSSRQEVVHLGPFFLPDGEHFLYLSRSQLWNSDPGDVICLGSLDSTFRPRVIIHSNTMASYASGYLLFGRLNTLMAQPFDIGQLQTTGDVLSIAEKLQLIPVFGHLSFSVSQNGVLVYKVDEGMVERKLRWYDRSGKEIGAIEHAFLSVYDPAISISPDGTRIAASWDESGSGNMDIWQYEVARGVWTRFTFNQGNEHTPLWSPDGRSVVYGSEEGGHWNLIQQPSSGEASERVLLKSDDMIFPEGWSPDGGFITYSFTYKANSSDIWILPMSKTGKSKPFPFLQTEFQEEFSTFSPDGRWIAYHSNESGKNEIFIRPFPGPGGKYQVSTTGGSVPRWRRDGKELFL